MSGGSIHSHDRLGADNHNHLSFGAVTAGLRASRASHCDLVGSGGEAAGWWRASDSHNAVVLNCGGGREGRKEVSKDGDHTRGGRAGNSESRRVSQQVARQ